MKRREFINTSVAGCLGASFLSNSTLSLAAQNSTPSFFLLVFLDGGLDTSYMFDARPRLFTEKGHITNYFSGGQEAYNWQGINGQSCLASHATKPLQPWKEKLAIINGLHMSLGFDGHLENFRALLTGHPFGGPLFTTPVVNQAYSLPFVINNINLFGVSNKAEGLTLTPTLARTLSQLSSSQKTRQTPGSQTAANRIDYWTTQTGLFSEGAKQVKSSLADAGYIGEKLAKLKVPENPNPEVERAHLITEVFKSGLSQRCFIRLPTDGLDVHDPQSCRLMPKRGEDLAKKIAILLDHFASIPIQEGSSESFLDHTTILIASEFGRTMRQAELDIDKCGTDHNALNNQIILAGKGIRGGTVWGSTDLDTLDSHGALQNPSPLHFQFDPLKLRVMGKCMDIETGQVLETMPESYDPSQFLTIHSLINALYESWAVPRKHWFQHPATDNIAKPFLSVFSS